MMVALSCWLATAGKPPSSPAATWTFCAWIAGRHIGGGQAVIVELGRVEPNAHGVFGAEQLVVADAVGAAERVLHGRRDEVGEVDRAEPAIGGRRSPG